MIFFNSLFQKIDLWKKTGNEMPLHITGAKPNQWSFLLKNILQKENHSFSNNNHIIVLPDTNLAENFYENIKKFDPSFYIDFFPGLEIDPYLKILSSESDLYKRFSLLNHVLTSKKKTILVCSLESFTLKVPPVSFFQENVFDLNVSDIISPHDLSESLVKLGYLPATSIEEPGTFCHKGEIFDIFPISELAVRIHYFDDMIEEIHYIDLKTQKTLKEKELDKITIGATPQVFSQKNFRSNLRENIPMPDLSQKEKFETRKRIFSHLAQNQLFENYPLYAPLFFNLSQTLSDFFLPEETIITLIEGDKSFQQSIEFEEELRESFEDVENDTTCDLILPRPNSIYDFSKIQDIKKQKSVILNDVLIDFLIDAPLERSIELCFESSKLFISRNIGPIQEKFQFVKKTFSFLKHFSNEKDGQIIFCYKNSDSLKEFQFLWNDNQEISPKNITFIKSKLNEGFYHKNENVLVLSEADLFSPKKKKSKNISNKNIDLFAEQISTLKKDDFIIHNDHGVGKYLGLESLNIGGLQSDFLILQYAQNDKVYVPVYKMNLIQKHADGSSQQKLANLRNTKFLQLKDRAKKAAKELAFDLLELQAKRGLAKAFAFSPPDHHFKEFELAFPFNETPDQLQAIENVLVEMQKHAPMDYLVCGDVGFGKTEVAMRASFKAVLDGKQVAILVPTTILAFQHFHSFSERFKNFPVHINLLSRFKSPKESKEIKGHLKEGKIDIIIGTHKLLSETIQYKDLGLVIVDEEQRFGVGHKEKLKLLKTSVDFLTLTATPIPRTLQLAFLGLKDLSLIQTAPPKRQSIKTYLIKEDDKTLKNAIEKELRRGGQVFIVHNRVKDIEIYTQKIAMLAPSANIVFAHGQMKESELEKRISDFYLGKYDVLISTTIIESGIDIPNANTMIINRAETFGLSQLHQLRGRIGRSDKKAYAYCIIPNEKILSSLAAKRLKALQTYADMGSGFAIASSDLEIRGAGDILGASQSGHVESIGLELYMDLLKDAVNELKGKETKTKIDLEISTLFPSYIPSSFIKDDSERLKQYKKLSNCDSLEKLEQNKELILDIFGRFPQEVHNLFMTLKCRILLQNFAMISFKAGTKSILISFNKSILEKNENLRNTIVSFFISRPKVYRFSPNFQITCLFKEALDQEAIIEFASLLAKKIVPTDPSES
jgi:transcription-repair coupling factor (superfamily II helicase)